MSGADLSNQLNMFHANVCRALADPKRIQILYALDSRPRHVSALAEDLQIPQPTVSRHLRVLRQQFLVKGERVGPAVIYRIRDKRIISALDTVQDVMLDSVAHQG